MDIGFLRPYFELYAQQDDANMFVFSGHNVYHASLVC